MPKTLYLVSCVKTKADQVVPAGELYISSWFKFARAFAENQGPWLILSAKHGVLDPTEAVEPYETTLNTMRRRERRVWAEDVIKELLARTQPGDKLVLLAGERYRENLIGPLKDAGREVEVPMYGLSQGRQLAWMKQKLEAAGLEPLHRQTGSADGKRELSAVKAAKNFTQVSRAVPSEARRKHLQELYHLLSDLSQGLGGAKPLKDCNRKMDWPQRGVYFFFERGEERTDSGSGPRVVRVGTHAVSQGSKSTLWGRLGQHQGLKSGGGNHRGSVFRKIVGASLAEREPALAVGSWGEGNTASGNATAVEHELESRVSQTLGEMPILWLDIGDEPSKNSLRSYIERNTISLLSNFRLDAPLDQPSANWLGHHCPKPKIRESGLWNSNHVDEAYDPAFLVTFRELLAAQLEGQPSTMITRPGSSAGDETVPSSPASKSTKERIVGAALEFGDTRGSSKGKRQNSWDIITERLSQHSGDSLTASFDEVDKWAGGALPPSATKHRPWWSGERVGWTAEGWVATPDFENGTVTFRKRSR